MGKTRYAIAIGSNRRHSRHGSPRHTVAAAVRTMGKAGLKIRASGPILSSRAMGPAGRDFANSAVIVSCRLDPPELLALLKAIERDFGRRPGCRWGPRVLDLDIVLWSEGVWADSSLIVPHPAFRTRAFVLDPLFAIVPRWRDPLTGLTIAHLRFRQRRRAASSRHYCITR